MSRDDDGPGRVVHEPDARRFALELDGHLAVLEYTLEGQRLTITHTGVPGAIGGRGIAARLVEAAALHARGSGLRVRPACSYAADWFGKHPEFADVLDA